MPESPKDTTSTAFVSWAVDAVKDQDFGRSTASVKTTRSSRRLYSPPPPTKMETNSGGQREISLVSIDVESVPGSLVIQEDSFGSQSYESSETASSDDQEQEEELLPTDSSSSSGILHLDIVKPEAPEVVKDKLQDDFVKEWVLSHNRFRQPAIIDSFSSSDDSSLDSSFDDEVPILFFCGKCRGPIEVRKRGKRKRAEGTVGSDVRKLAECGCYDSNNLANEMEAVTSRSLSTSSSTSTSYSADETQYSESLQ